MGSFMSKFSYIFLLLILVFQLGFVTKERFAVRNLKENYLNFYNRINSSEMTVEEKISVWDEEIERAWPEFYNEIIHAKQYSDDWEDRKLKSFDRLITHLPKIHDDIVKNFNEFEGVVNEQISHFRETFSDLDLSGLEIVAAPSLLRFNGQVSIVNKKPVAGFGMDMIAFLKHKPNFLPGMNYRHNSSVFYSHEIFHFYHNKKQGLQWLSRDEYNAMATMAVPLWNEGMATYISRHVNPEAKLGELFMDANLVDTCVPQLDHLKKMYAEIVHKKHPDNQIDYVNWFLLSSKNKEVPIRAGYCLGYFVAKDLIEQHGLETALSWELDKIIENVGNYFQ